MGLVEIFDVMTDEAGVVDAQWHGPGGGGRLRWHFRWSDLLWQLVFPRNGQRILPTVSGMILVALSFGIGTAAYNSANNILFITLSLLLACLILSGVLSWLNLRGVAWRLRIAPPLRAGQEAAVTIELRNRKQFLPTYGLWFDVLTSLVPPDGVAPAGDKPPRVRRVREVLAAVEKGRTRARLFLRTRLDANGEARLDWAFKPAKRGVQRLALESVGSRFPFGFLQKFFSSSLRQDAIVWPAPVEYRRWGAASTRPQLAGQRVARAGSGGDLLALRKYEPGDSHRLIHWKASARSRHLLVRQFAAESQEMIALWLQTPADDWTRPEQFERLVSLAATLAEDLFRTGQLASVAVNAEPPRPVRRVRDLEAFLDQLATVQPVAAMSPIRPGFAPPWSPDQTEPRFSNQRRNVLTFAPDGPHGVSAYVDGEKTAAA